MFYVATGLLFDRSGKLLIYLRDNKPGISYPNHWDLFGGIIEKDETPEQARVREVEEELGIRIATYTKFREYDCMDEGTQPNKKYVFYARINFTPQELTLTEGQRMTSILLSERLNYKFANILGIIINDFANSGISIQ